MRESPSIEQELRNRILILDGALGTMIQNYHLDEEDFHIKGEGGTEVLQKGNNDILSISRPDVIEDIHRRYLEAGADIIETNTFNAQTVSQEDYQMESMCREMNRASCAIARKVADEYTLRNLGKPRFVAGSIGPTNKTCSLATDINRPEWRAVSFDGLRTAYGEQIHEMLLGGVDVLLIETIFDTLNAKAALFAAEERMEMVGRSVPVMLSVTIADKSGRTLSGQTIQAFLASVAFAPLLSVGFNCSFGPKEMKPFVQELSDIAPYYVSVYPNAGLPNELGQYDVNPQEMQGLMREFVDKEWVNIIGGCCGTTDEHIALYVPLVEEAREQSRLRKPVSASPYLCLSGLDSFEISLAINFVNIGERCNVAGSRKFLRLISQGEYEEAMSIARKQVEDGAQIVDINMDDGLLDAREQMVRFINMLATDPEVARIPLMIDSSNWDVIQAGLKCVQGKCIVNSISLKEGEEIFLQKAAYIQRMGAAVVVMAFDEEGQACTYEKKIQVCERAYRLLTEKLHYNPVDIVFDPNILSIGTGIPEHDNYAVNFINAVEWIHNKFPKAHISGGVSNLSFSFRGNNHIREAMHAVFLYHAIAKGMDMGIVNPASKVMYDDIPAKERELLENLIFNRTPDAADQLLAYISSQSDSGKVEKEMPDPRVAWMSHPLEDRLKRALVEGVDTFLQEDLQEAVKKYGDAVSIIEGPLMDGMGVVGERFALGKMFLPQVVRTAKVMQKAVSVLSPYIESKKTDSVSCTGRMIMATVKGDVHDIGKNIVGVVLKCNNFRIYDMGVMCPAERIIEQIKTEPVDIIGLCGLITPSLTEMINTVKALNGAGITLPVIIGGATTSELHTALRIAPAYNGPVIWSKDAAQTAIVATTLMNTGKREKLLEEVAERYALLRQEYERKEQQVRQSTIEEARKNKLNLFTCNCCNHEDKKQ